MEEAVNIPLPDWTAMRGRRSDTPARRRNGALKGGRYTLRRQIHAVCRAPTVRRAPGRADSGGNHAPEKIRYAPGPAGPYRKPTQVVG